MIFLELRIFLRRKFSEKFEPCWELRNIYHPHPESKKRRSSEANSGSIHPYGRYENAVKTRKTISTIAILWPFKAIFEKRAATAEVDTLISPALILQVRKKSHKISSKAPAKLPCKNSKKFTDELLQVFTSQKLKPI